MSSPLSNAHMSQSALSDHLGWVASLVELPAVLKSALVYKFVSRVACACVFQMPEPWRIQTRVISRNANDASKIASVKVLTKCSKEEFLRRINRRPMPHHWAFEKYSGIEHSVGQKDNWYNFWTFPIDRVTIPPRQFYNYRFIFCTWNFSIFGYFSLPNEWMDDENTSSSNYVTHGYINPRQTVLRSSLYRVKKDVCYLFIYIFT